MPITMQTVVDKARTPLNDAKAGSPLDGVRYKDAELMGYLNSALDVLTNKRPDLFIGKYLDPEIYPNGERVLADPFPLSSKWVQPCADLVTAMAESKDDEHVLSQRVEAFINRAASLIG